MWNPASEHGIQNCANLHITYNYQTTVWCPFSKMIESWAHPCNVDTQVQGQLQLHKTCKNVHKFQELRKSSHFSREVGVHKLTDRKREQCSIIWWTWIVEYLEIKLGFNWPQEITELTLLESVFGVAYQGPRKAHHQNRSRWWDKHESESASQCHE
jgi:hypothetical protein